MKDKGSIEEYDENKFKIEFMENVNETVKSVGDGVKELGEGIKDLGNIAKDNRKEAQWYVKLMLIVMVGIVGLFGVTLLRNPEGFSREHICTENGYTTKFTNMEAALNFKELYPKAKCEFKTQEEKGWIGLIKNKIGIGND